MGNSKSNNLVPESGYIHVNGLKMYFEIYGTGNPLFLIHGGGSTIGSSFGRLIPIIAKRRKVIGVELQAHGRTGDRDSGLSFEQDADDLAMLMKKLNIPKADFFGFSNGGTTAMQIAIRHPALVKRLILGSALAKRGGAPAPFWEFMKQARLDNMPEELKIAYLEVAADPTALQVMHDKDANRMVHFKDIPDDKIRSITQPTLIIVGDRDVITAEHAMEMHRLLPNSELAIIPGGHGEYMGELTTLKDGFKSGSIIVPLLENFLDK